MDKVFFKLLLFIFIILLCGCSSDSDKLNSLQISETTSQEEISADLQSITLFDKDELLKNIYSNYECSYDIYESELIDTYFIACALYFDFQCNELLPNTKDYKLYKDTENYFKPYKDHIFIQNLEKYVDVQYKTKRDGVVFPLLMYAFSEVDYNTAVDTVQTDVFQNGEEFNSFLKSLYSFYIDTNAKEFFQSQVNQSNMSKYIKENIEKASITDLINSMEKYVGNKQKLYSDKTIKYCSVVTLYRPFNASFFNLTLDNTLYIIGQQSPNDSTLNPEIFDINQMMKTTIHEFLHNYINQPVAQQTTLIEQLAKGKEKKDYTNPMYQSMPWNRIVDESIVRVVEARIYEEVLDDKQKAFNLILEPEIKWSGMPKLKEMYDKLEEYENNRDTYKIIDEYITVLIETMFS